MQSPSQHDRHRTDLIAVTLIIGGLLAVVFVAFTIHPLLGTAVLGGAFMVAGIALGHERE